VEEVRTDSPHLISRRDPGFADRMNVS
jgi:hypothetical protein